VSIFGKEYDIKGDSNEAYIKSLAAYVDSVMREISARTGTISPSRLAILTALNIADEMFKDRQRLKELTEKLGQELGKALDSMSKKPETSGDAE